LFGVRITPGGVRIVSTALEDTGAMPAVTRIAHATCLGAISDCRHRPRPCRRWRLLRLRTARARDLPRCDLTLPTTDGISRCRYLR